MQKETIAIVLSKLMFCWAVLLSKEMVQEDKANFGNTITHVWLFWAYGNP